MNQSLARNTIFSAFSTASNVLLLLLIIVAGRILGDADFGIFSLALAIATIFEIMIDFGVSTLTVKNVARDRSLARHYLHTTLPWRFALGAAMFLLLIPTAQVLGKTADARIVIYVLGIAIFLRSLKATSHAFFRAYERFDLILMTTYSERILVLILCGMVLLQTNALIPFALAFALARMPDLIFSYWLLHRKVARLGWNASVPHIRDLQVEALPFGSLNIVTVMYAYLGTVILGVMRPAPEVGWYGAGFRIYEGLTMFPFILCMVLLPRLSNLHVSDSPRHHDLSARSLKYLVILGLPIMVTGWLLAPEILRLVFGADFVDGTAALRMLFAASVFMFCNLLLNTVLISADRQAQVLKVSATGLAISVTAHIVLIGIYGVTGAGIAVLIAEICVFLIFMRLIPREILRAGSFISIWKPVTACTIALLALNWPQIGEPLPAAAVFLAIYLPLVLILKAFDKYEWSAAKSIVFRNAGN